MSVKFSLHICVCHRVLPGVIKIGFYMLQEKPALLNLNAGGDKKQNWAFGLGVRGELTRHLWGDHIYIYREKKEVHNLPFDSPITTFLARFAVTFLQDPHFYMYLILSALEVWTFEYTLGKFPAYMPYDICNHNIYGSWALSLEVAEWPYGINWFALQ